MPRRRGYVLLAKDQGNTDKHGYFCAAGCNYRLLVAERLPSELPAMREKSGAGPTALRPVSRWIRRFPRGTRRWNDGKYRGDRKAVERRRINYEQREALPSPKRPPRKTKSPPYPPLGLRLPPHMEGESLYGSEAIQYVCPRCETDNKIGVPNRLTID